MQKNWFLNVFGGIPREPIIGDRNTLDSLRRDNLDIFWSRDTGIVKGILEYTKKIKSRER